MSNGDQMTGELKADAIKLTAAWGDVTIDLKHLYTAHRKGWDVIQDFETQAAPDGSGIATTPRWKLVRLPDSGPWIAPGGSPYAPGTTGVGPGPAAYSAPLDPRFSIPPGSRYPTAPKAYVPPTVGEEGRPSTPPATEPRPDGPSNSPPTFQFFKSGGP
jgi:hypothetical protein